jgi:hypothetical protein
LEDPKEEVPVLDLGGGIVLPSLPLHLESLIREVHDSICSKPKSLDDEVLKVDQQEIDQAADSLVSIIRYLGFLLPRVLHHFIAQALRNDDQLNAPRRSERVGMGEPAPAMMDVMQKNEVSTERPIKEYLNSRMLKKVLGNAVKAFQLLTLTTSDTLRHVRHITSTLRSLS